MMGDSVLIPIVAMLAVVVFFGFLNEKTVKLPTEIALLLAGLCLSVIVIIMLKLTGRTYYEEIHEFLLDKFLVEGILCFMLFAGACKLRYCDLKEQLRLITCMAILSTTIATVVYGSILFGLASILGLTQLSFLECILLGCIVAPTDPIAAMSILKKAGLPEDIALVIEGESLFNDGVGVALFAIVSGIISGTNQSVSVATFLELIGKEILGALIVGAVVSVLLYKLFVLTGDIYRQIFISLLAVSFSYVACEAWGFSSAIAAVVCGISFATYMDKPESKNPEIFRVYRDFWDVIDSLLNSTLYVMLGLTFVNLVLFAPGNYIWILLAIVINIVARYIGIYMGSLPIKNKPQELKQIPFTNLLTWAGLKGALCLALAMSAESYLSAEAFQVILIATFGVVMFTTLGQGLTIGTFYKKQYQDK